MNLQTLQLICNIARRDLRALTRDRAALIFTLLFPVCFGIFFGVVLTGGQQQTAIPIAIIDHEQSPRTQALLTSIEQTDRFTITRPTPAQLQTTTELVRTGRLSALITINEGFTASIEHPAFEGPPTLQLITDPARRAESALIEGVLATAAAQTLIEAQRDPAVIEQNINRAEQARTQQDLSTAQQLQLNAALAAARQIIAQLPARNQAAGNEPDTQAPPLQLINIERTPLPKAAAPSNLFAITFAQSAIWAMLGSAAAFAATLATERSAGTLTRLLAAPVAPTVIMAGKAAACLTLAASVSILMILIARLGFGVHITQPITMAVSVLAVSICAVGLMMTLAALGRKRASVGQFAWGLILLMAMTGGGMLPLAFMPSWMEPVSHASPVRWAILAIEGASWRQMSPAQLILPWLILLAIGTAGFALGSAILTKDRS